MVCEISYCSNELVIGSCVMNNHEKVSSTIHCSTPYVGVLQGCKLSVNNSIIYLNEACLHLFVPDSIDFSCHIPFQNIIFCLTSEHSRNHPHFSNNAQLWIDYSRNISLFSILRCNTKNVFRMIWPGTFLSCHSCRKCE